MTDYDAELKALLADKIPPPLDQPCAREQRNATLSAQDFDDLVERAGAAEFWESEYNAAARDARRWRGLFWCAAAVAVAISAAATWGPR